MPAQRKVFRIEQMSGEGTGEDWPAPSEPPPAMPIPMQAAAPASDEATHRHQELIAEIKALRMLIEPKDEAQRILETYQAQLVEMQKLKSELIIIHNAITR